MVQQAIHSNYLEKLGLRSDPFQPSLDPTAEFISPQFEQYLQKASHLCRYGGQLLAVIGAAGHGKTFFLNKLAAELVDIPKSVFVDAAQALSADNILQTLVLRLSGGEAHAPDGVGAKLALLRSLLAAELEPPLLLIDNAGQLTDQELGMLQSLMMAGAEAPPIRMVMSGERSLVDRLDMLNALDVIVYDIELEPISVEHWQSYCDHCLAQAGLSGKSPFSGQELNRVVAIADGNIGDVFGQLKTLLRSKAESKEANLKLGLPPAHLLGVVALVSCLIIVILAGEHLFSGARDSKAGADFQTELIEGIDVSAGEPLPKVAEQEGDQHRDAEVIVEPRTKESSSVVDGDGQRDSLFISQPLGTPSSDAAVESDKSSNPLETTPIIEGVLPGETGADERLDSGSLGELGRELLVEPTAEEQEDEESEIKKGTAIAPQLPINAIDSDADASSVTKGPFQGVSEDFYVLQIMAANDVDALENFVAEQVNRESLQILNLSQSRKSWFVVVQGQYRDLNLAREGIKNLPKSQQRDGPWPRTIKEIKSLLKEDSD